MLGLCCRRSNCQRMLWMQRTSLATYLDLDTVTRVPWTWRSLHTKPTYLRLMSGSKVWICLSSQYPPLLTTANRATDTTTLPTRNLNRQRRTNKYETKFQPHVVNKTCRHKGDVYWFLNFWHFSGLKEGATFLQWSMLDKTTMVTRVRFRKQTLELRAISYHLGTRVKVNLSLFSFIPF